MLSSFYHEQIDLEVNLLTTGEEIISAFLNIPQVDFYHSSLLF